MRMECSAVGGALNCQHVQSNDRQIVEPYLISCLMVVDQCAHAGSRGSGVVGLKKLRVSQDKLNQAFIVNSGIILTSISRLSGPISRGTAILSLRYPISRDTF